MQRSEDNSTRVHRVSLELLRTIGITQMEKEFEEKVKFLRKHYESLEEDKPAEMKEDDIKQILHEVLDDFIIQKKIRSQLTE